MSANRVLCTVLLSLATLLATPSAPAQTTTERGDIVVHHSAIATTALQPEVARQYAITRSAGRALLNIAVQRRQADGSTRAVTAAVSGAATTASGQRQELAVREVREGDAIYYLAEPRITAPETLNFELAVTPEGESAPLSVRFSQEFFPPPAR